MADPITAVQFFEHPVVQFPIERDKDDFELFVGERLQAYVELVRRMDAADSITQQIKGNVDRIENLCNLLKSAIHEYLRGFPHRAYAEFDKGIGSVRRELDLFPGPVDHPFVKELYRIRKEDEPGSTFNKKELFHIPFDLRHKVTRQRYSIPGLPCLYLGGSLYVCWEELQRPRFESVHVARFEPAPGEKIHVLDFMQRPLHIAANVRNNQNMANTTPPLRNGYCALAMCWPLMASGAIRRRHGSAPFIAEYIIPQLLLQWIADNNDPNLDGIAYSSVSCKTHVTYPAGISNLVFPAKEFAPQGHCRRLLRKFAMTDPIAWHLLERISISPHFPFAREMKLELIPGHPTAYEGTAFGQLEAKLCGLKAAVL